MTKEQYLKLKPFENIMKSIIINASAAGVPIEYREIVADMGRKEGYNICTTCSSGIFTLTSRLYNEYIKIKANEEEIRQREFNEGNPKKHKGRPKNSVHN